MIIKATMSEFCLKRLNIDDSRYILGKDLLLFYSQNEGISWLNLKAMAHIAIIPIFFNCFQYRPLSVVKLYEFNSNENEEKQKKTLEFNDTISGYFELFCLNCFRKLILNEFFTGMSNKNEKSTTQLLFFWWKLPGATIALADYVLFVLDIWVCEDKSATEKLYQEEWI